MWRSVGVGAGISVLVGATAISIAAGWALATWVIWACWAAIAVGIAVRFLRSGPRAVTGEMFDGFDRVQGIYLGRKDLGPIAWAAPEERTTELVVDRRDPLSDDVWTVGSPAHPGAARTPSSER